MRRFVSETYELIDATFVDRGTSSDYGAWTNWSGYEPKLVRTDYCAVTVDTAQSKTLARMYKSFDPSSNDVAIEFDLKVTASSTNEQFGTLRNSSATSRGILELNRFGGSLNTWHHLKIIVSTTNARIYLDNSANPVYTYTASDITRLYIDFDTDVTELDYKNFVIYPI